jgi:acetyl esterase/lipase
MPNKALIAFPLLLLISSACALAGPLPAASPSPYSSPGIPSASPSPEASPIPLQTSALPAPHAPVEKGVTYCTAEGIPLPADIYFAQNAARPAPLLIFIHGGGWSGGSRSDSMGSAVQPLLSAAGYTLASLDYRLAPRYKMPAMIEDVKCAVRSFRAHALEYNIDPDRIGVIGVSAGAHLAALLGTADESAGFDVGEYAGYSSRVQAVVDMAGPVDLTDPSTPYAAHLAEQVFGVRDPADPRFAAASPVTWITPDDASFLIIHGDADDNVPLAQSQELYEALTAAGVEARLIVVKNGGHSLDTPGQSPSREELAAEILRFLQENLK